MGNSASKEHLELASYIKDVHHNLRRDAAKIGFDAAWQKHCGNAPVLEKYAASMANLAQEHWDPNSTTDFAESRIAWVRSHCDSYFNQGGLKSADETETKKMRALLQDPSYHLKSPPQNLKPPLRLLDVGSCYNPFSEFPEFDVVAVDIAPGQESVKKCDFINISIGENLEDETSITGVAPNSFEVVVFSLLLEYFPSREARFQCCKNAYEVLKPCGVLVIVTPDSKHATANAPLMRQWRVALATLGFWRVYYEKLQHLHCMVFRKASDPDFPKLWATRELMKHESLQNFESPAQMMAIPQDGNVLEEKSPPEKIDAQSDLFEELPLNDSDFSD